PVYGIAQSSMLAACTFGHRFSILSPLDRFRPVLESLVRFYGLEALCASVRTVNMDVRQSFDDLKAANTAFALEARRAVEEDGAEVICLGGAVFAGRDRAIGEEAGGVVCIDGLSAALKQAEAYHALGYASSKVGLFETPRAKVRTLPGGVEI
ncbi:MAG: aspartate/glutamate racemase family protein, partial [Fretibacterium sp.]|nr:aspartate/glutamate racemase family protein [Fretibacterium sp.]